MRQGIPRLPLDGSIDLTYRCNNNCRHCWLWLPPDASQSRDELSLDEIRRIAEEARGMGCQAWAISGGEPMLRPDFPEILDYITHRSRHFTLNTNGTLITPEIARLLTRRGHKMVALYGATPDVHDLITRSPGSFHATMRGLAYMREAGAAFTVQLIPMRGNYHQYDAMLELASGLSPSYRLGATWLHPSACRSPSRNREILRQRLDPVTAVELDDLDPSSEHCYEPTRERARKVASCGAAADDRPLAACVTTRQAFHVDPYGQMSSCCFIKDPALRYDLRRGCFSSAWEEFIPSIAEAVRGGTEYAANCGSCALRCDCHWCAVHGWLEHGRFSAKVAYLCRMAAETRRRKDDWRRTHVRWYQIAGVTIQVAADFAIANGTFAAKFAKFAVDGPGADTVVVRLRSAVPSRSELRLGTEVHNRPPWTVYRNPGSWTYLVIPRNAQHPEPHSVSIFNTEHTRGTIFRHPALYGQGNLESLSLFPSDQILLGRLLADRQGCIIHASGIDLVGKGLLFVGHSGAGKSTLMKMLRGRGEILCDDRIIVRRWPDGFRMHGTWSHGELPDVSPTAAPLRAIFYLEKADGNQLVPILSPKERLRQVLAYVVKPLVTADWWAKTLDLAGKIAAEVPAYHLRFDRGGGVVGLLEQL